MQAVSEQPISTPKAFGYDQHSAGWEDAHALIVDRYGIERWQKPRCLYRGILAQTRRARNLVNFSFAAQPSHTAGSS